jgi:beta-galactosidase GanA
LWWSDIKEESLYARTYLAEYRGVVKWLLHEHIPFDVIVRPDIFELAGYEAVIAPALTAISNDDVTLLKRYVADGGTLIITGSNPTGQDEYGNERHDFALGDIMERSKVTKMESIMNNITEKVTLSTIPTL